LFFFFQAEDGIRDSVASRGLGDVYKRQEWFFNLKEDGNFYLHMRILFYIQQPRPWKEVFVIWQSKDT